MDKDNEMENVNIHSQITSCQSVLLSNDPTDQESANKTKLNDLINSINHLKVSILTFYSILI